MKKEWLAREVTMEIIVGAFMVVVMLGLGYFTIILSRETWFGPKHTIRVRFQDVMGLREGDSVVVRGMPIGKVKTLELVRVSDGSRVLVTAMLDKEIALHEGYKMTVAATSILGGRMLQIDEGPETGKRIPIDDVFDGQQPYDIVADAAETINMVKDIVTRINEGKGLLGRLLSEDDTLYDNFASAVASIKNVAERLDKGEGTIGKLLSSDDTLYKDLSDAAASLKNVSAKLERGEGLLGKLINDESLYEQVQKAVDEIRATVDDYRETAPVITFTSVFFGAL